MASLARRELRKRSRGCADRFVVGAVLVAALLVASASALPARVVTTEDARRLTRTEVGVGSPAWSPDGGEIAFVAWRGRNRYDISATDVDGSYVRYLTHTDAWEASPLWSPDATRVLYWTNRKDAPGVYVMNRQRGDHTPVVTDGGWYALGSWSPDGARIAVAVEAQVFEGRFPDTEIITMDLTGQNRVNLTRHPADERHPSWSPDGSKIAFMSARDGDGGIFSDYEIYTMDPDGANPTRLTYDVLVDRGQVSWSPDSARIAFTSRVATDDGWQQRISIMYADGSGRIDLTTGSANDRSPTWSPDGASLAFVSDRDAPLVFDKVTPGWVPAFTEIYVLDVSNVTPVRPRGSKLVTWGRLKAAAGVTSVDSEEGRE